MGPICVCISLFYIYTSIVFVLLRDRGSSCTGERFSMPHFTGWRHFHSDFPAVLQRNPSLPSISAAVRPAELCVITQLETISLLHICCQGSAKNGTTVGLGDLTSSYGAAELPTPTGRKSNTNRLRDDWVNEPNPGGEDTPRCHTSSRTAFLSLL